MVDYGLAVEIAASKTCPLPVWTAPRKKPPTIAPSEPVTFQQWALIQEESSGEYATLRVHCTGAKPIITLHNFRSDTLAGPRRAARHARPKSAEDGWFKTLFVEDYARIVCKDRRAVVWRTVTSARLESLLKHPLIESGADDAEPLATTVVVVGVNGVSREEFATFYPRSMALLRNLQSENSRSSKSDGFWGAEFRRYVSLAHDRHAADAIALAQCSPFRHGVEHCNVSETHIENHFISAG